jgi:hypothetical protein
MKQSIWRERSASDVMDQHQTLPRGDGKGPGGGSEHLLLNYCGARRSLMLWQVSLQLLNSYTTSARKSKKRVTRFLGVTIKIA